jgi:hypothetical membrane protein
MVRRIIFLFGVIAVAVYVVAVVMGAALRPGYDHLSYAISELISAGAPNKTLLDGLFIAYNVLVIAFAWALGMSTRGAGSGLAVAGAAILAGVGLVSIVMTLFFPMDPRGSPATTAGLVHLILAGVESLGSILAILFFTLGTRDHGAFWVYSLVSVILVFVSGAFAAVTASLGSPVLGLAERVTIGLFLQWIAALSIKLVKEDLGR